MDNDIFSAAPGSKYCSQKDAPNSVEAAKHHGVRISLYFGSTAQVTKDSFLPDGMFHKFSSSRRRAITFTASHRAHTAGIFA